MVYGIEKPFLDTWQSNNKEIRIDLGKFPPLLKSMRKWTRMIKINFLEFGN